MSSCRTNLPDGRPRRLNMNATALVAETIRPTPPPPDPELAQPELPSTEDAGTSRAREICISVTILVSIVSVIGFVIVAF